MKDASGTSPNSAAPISTANRGATSVAKSKHNHGSAQPTTLTPKAPVRPLSPWPTEAGGDLSRFNPNSMEVVIAKVNPALKTRSWRALSVRANEYSRSIKKSKLLIFNARSIEGHWGEKHRKVKCFFRVADGALDNFEPADLSGWRILHQFARSNPNSVRQIAAMNRPYRGNSCSASNRVERVEKEFTASSDRDLQIVARWPALRVLWRDQMDLQRCGQCAQPRCACT